MNFNFYELYKDYSTPELLRVLQRPGDYQATAVEVVKDILRERNHSIEELGQFNQEVEAGGKTRTEKGNRFQEIAAFLAKPVLQSRQGVTPNKWLNVLLVLLVLQLIWSSYNGIEALSVYLQCLHCPTSITIWLMMLSPVFTGVVLFLLLKQRPLGWILFFGVYLFLCVIWLNQLNSFIRYYYQGGLNILPLLPIIIKVLLLVFLWRKDVAGIFNVTKQTKKRTALVAVVTALIVMVMADLLYG